ncbi:MAG: sugar phosphate isomerase/epimerase, partial [Planctomycetes bacterium]|nr:sugar phosphate isomerase/epimerase [Planctomycetota bacterium]
MVKPCVATWTVKSDSLARTLRVMADMGFRAVSFCSSQPSAVAREWPEVMAILRDHDLDVLFHLALGGNPRTPKEVELAPQLASVLALHEKTGRVKTVCFDPAYQVGEAKKNVADLPGTAAGLRHAIEKLTPCGIRVGIENWSISGRIEQFEWIKREVGDDRLGMLLDIGHAHIMAEQQILPPGMTPAAYVDALPFPLYELHLHDNHGKDDEHLAIGDGDLKLDSIVRAIQRKGFDGHATVEVIPGLKTMPIEDAAALDGIRRTKAA